MTPAKADPPQPNDLCECGHTREEHRRLWHRKPGCRCRGFVQAYWTEEEVATAKREGERYAEILGVKR